MKMNQTLLTAIGFSAAMLNAADWQTTGSNQWNTARHTAAELQFSGNGSGESRAQMAQANYQPLGWYAIDFDLRTELKHREWPVGAPYLETPFKREEFWDPSEVWRHFTIRLQAPENPGSDAFIAFGQKDHTGDAQMRNIQLRQVFPQAVSIAGTPLRRHEAIFGNTFYANEDVETIGRRNEFTAANPLILHYALPGRKFRDAVLVYNGTNARIELSHDGIRYTEAGAHRQDSSTVRLLKVGDSADAVYLRLTPLDPAKSGTLNHTRLTAKVDGAELNTAGQTFFVSAARKLELRRIEYDPRSMRYSFTVDAVNDGKVPLKFAVTLFDGQVERASAPPVTVAPAGRETLTLSTTLPETGERTLTFSDPKLGALLRSDVNLAVINDLSHGEKLNTPGTDLWIADSAYRVNRFRPAPQAETEALKLELARNESRSRQLVIRSSERSAELIPGDLSTDSGAVLPADSFDIRLVDQLFITNSTDPSGAVGFWPDPVSALSGPAEVRPGENTVLMVTVRSSSATAPGLYRGTFGLKLGENSHRLPVEVRVFDFALPEESSITAVSELSPKYIEMAHRAKTMAEKRAVFEEYLKLFADSRVSPYVPTPYDLPVVDWPQDGSADVKVDFSHHKKELERVLAAYHFKRFVVTIPLPPGISSLKDDMTPTQEAQFSAVAREFERFYEENGLLDNAFLYVWDEPHVNVFADTDRALARLKKYAPKLKRMITPFWVQDRWRPALDIWAFLSHHYVNFATAGCRKNNEELWWYVCTNPRAPYATGFIDHGGAELRTWLWQTLQYKMAGTLYWSSTFWCDASAPGYPLRDLYRKPMFFNEAGNEFGNGDGQLVYPPRAAFDEGSGLLATVPSSSLRLLAWRDGLQDTEYFKLLEQRLNKLPPGERRKLGKLLEIPNDVSVSLYEYNFLPDAMNRHRAKLAEALEFLNKK